MKICLNCKDEFKSKHKKALFCSRSCSALYNHKVGRLKKPQPKYSKEELINMILKAKELLGKTPSRREFSALPFADASTIRNYFGSWNKAIIAAGLPIHENYVYEELRRHGLRAPSLTLRYKVLERDKFRCQYCGASPKEARLVIDHVVPVSKNGPTVKDNLITSCWACNAGKTDLG